MDSEAWPVGSGMVFLDWVYCLLGWGAAIYSACIEMLGADRRRTLRFARRLLVVGTTLLAATAAYRLWQFGDIPISMPALLAQSLLFVAVILFARDTLGIRGARLWPPNRPPLA